MKCVESLPYNPGGCEWSLLDAFIPLFPHCAYFLNVAWPEAIAKVLFQTCDLLMPDQPGAFASTRSRHISTLDNTEENFI